MDKKSAEKKPEKPSAVAVIWTEFGEASKAHSEHGQHKAGEEVVTVHHALCIERGWAKAKS